MNTNNSTKRLSDNALRAEKEALVANEAANEGRTNRDRKNTYQQVNSQWKRTMSGSPVFLLTIIFLFCAIAEIVYSWEMYREFLAAFFGDPHWSIILLLGLIIVLGAAYVSHLLSKTLSANLFSLEVFNYRFITNNGYILEEEAVEHINNERKKDLRNGIIGTIGFLIVVALISWHRAWLMTDAMGVDDYSLIQKLLPVIIVLLEILTGIYLGIYLIPLWKNQLKIRKAHNRFKHNIRLCSKQDRLVKALIDSAYLNSEHFTPAQNVMESYYRARSRAVSSDNYLDEVELKRIEVVTVDKDNQPVSNVRVVGMLSNQTIVGGGISNGSGFLAISWDSQDEYIDLIINNFTARGGPFKANSSHVVCIDEPLVLSS